MRAYPYFVQKAYHNYTSTKWTLALLIVIGIVMAVMFQRNGWTKSSLVSIWIVLCSAAAFFVIRIFQTTAYTRNGESFTTLEKCGRSFLSVFMLFGGFALIAVMFYLVVQYSMQSNSSGGQWMLVIVQWIFLLSLVGTLFKVFNFGGIVSNHPISRLITYSILYIPCFAVYLTSSVGRAFGLLGKTNTSLTSVQSVFSQPSTPQDRAFLLSMLALYGAVFAYHRWLRPTVSKRLTEQGGVLWVGSPTRLTTETLVGTYTALSSEGQEETSKPIYDYRYAISFWIYIDSFGPAESTRDVQVMGYGNTISMRYQSFVNEFVFQTKQTSADANPRVLFRVPSVKLQKWNHVVLQNHGGTMDIFYNGELAKSAAQVVSQIGADTLSIGDPKGAGVSGDITDLVYFNKPIDITTVRRIYALGTRGEPSGDAILPTFESSFRKTANDARNAINKGMKSASPNIHWNDAKPRDE